MGRDPKNSVVDAHLRSHDHPNLFILGSAVFPTAATANPTLTIAALSLRAVDQVKAALTQ
jgi:choline dehydrogenase-like flavoprotein